MFDLETAKNMLSDPFSCCEQMTSVRNICLLPRCLGNITAGIKSLLDVEINLYCSELESVVIAYDNLKFLQPSASIVDDSPYLYFKVQADFILFKPTIGSILKGVVNKVSKDHVGCLVHSRFNASVHRPRNLNNKWGGSSLSAGEEFPFRVQNVFANNGVISMKGQLVDDEAVTGYLKSKTETEDMEGIDDSNNDSLSSKSKKRKDKSDILEETQFSPKKRKSTDKGELNSVDDSTNNISIISNDDGESTRVKRHKKKKKKHSREQSPGSTMDSSKQHSDTAENKQKEEPITDVTSSIVSTLDSSFAQNDDSDSKKKRHKKSKRTRYESLNENMTESTLDSSEGRDSSKKRRHRERTESVDGGHSSVAVDSVYLRTEKDNVNFSGEVINTNDGNKRHIEEQDSLNNDVDESASKKRHKKKKKKHSRGESQEIEGLNSANGNDREIDRKTQELNNIALSFENEVSRLTDKVMTASPTKKQKNRKKKKKKRDGSVTPEREIVCSGEGKGVLEMGDVSCEGGISVSGEVSQGGTSGSGETSQGEKRKRQSDDESFQDERARKKKKKSKRHSI